MLGKTFNKKHELNRKKDMIFERTEAYKVFKSCGSLEATREAYIDKVIGPILVMYNRQVDFPKVFADAEKMKEKSKAWFGKENNPLEGFDCGLSTSLIAYSQYCSALYYNYCDLQYVHSLLGKGEPVLTDDDIRKNIAAAYARRTTLHYELTDEIIDMVCRVIGCVSEIAKGDKPYIPGMVYEKKYQVLRSVCDAMRCEYYKQICDAEMQEIKKRRK